MSITRQSILRGPAIVQMSGQSIYTAGDIKVAIQPDAFQIPTALYGKVGERLSDIILRISFTPVGMWTTGLLAVLFPRTAPVNGASIFGASDVPVVIHPVNGTEKVTFTAGAVTKMPGLKLSPIETLFKEMEITLLIKNGSDRSAAEAILALADTAFSDSSFSLASVLTVPYTAGLSGASAPWDSFETEDGFDVDFSETLAPVRVANIGTIDMTQAGLDISVKFKPVGMTVAQVLSQMKLQGTGVFRGMDLSAGAANLTITGGTDNPQVVINSVRLKTAPHQYGAEVLRHDTLEMIATRPAGAGTMFTVGVAA